MNRDRCLMLILRLVLMLTVSLLSVGRGNSQLIREVEAFMEENKHLT